MIALFCAVQQAWLALLMVKRKLDWVCGAGRLSAALSFLIASWFGL
jgi:hypothetical protein